MSFRNSTLFFPGSNFFKVIAAAVVFGVMEGSNDNGGKEIDRIADLQQSVKRIEVSESKRKRRR